MNVSDLISMYLAHPVSRTADRTARVQHLRTWEMWLKHIELLDLVRTSKTGKQRASAELIRAWQMIQTKCKTASTANRYREHMSACFSAGEKGLLGDDIADEILTNPIKLLEPLREQQRYRRSLTIEEVRALLNSCRKSRNKELYPLVRLALLSGRRRGELLSARMEWFDPFKRLLVIPAEYTKTKRRDSVIAMHDQDLFDYAMSKQGDEMLFSKTDFRRAFEEALKRANIAKACFHSLRHTCVTLLSYGGGDAPALYVGHDSPDMTKRYLHSSEHFFNEQQQIIVKAIEGQEPRFTAPPNIVLQ